MNYPKKSAFTLAKKLREFRKQSELVVSSEVNINANADMREVMRQIDWSAYNNIVNQLEFCYKHENKNPNLAAY